MMTVRSSIVVSITTMTLFGISHESMAHQSKDNVVITKTQLQDHVGGVKIERSVNMNRYGYSKTISPHWDKSKCNVCHTDSSTINRSTLLSSDPDELCKSCHDEKHFHSYIHPVEIGNTKSHNLRLKEKWKEQIELDSKRQLACITCHDLKDQCLPGRRYMVDLNPGFIREGPYAKRTDLCYKCHDEEQYKRLNPHDQIDSNGMIKLTKCRLCHVVNTKTSLKRGIIRDIKRFPLLNALNYDRALICIRCHKKIDHPTSAFRVVSINKYRHLVKITEEKMATLEKETAMHNVVMPLEPVTNRVYCGTCHEAHQPGMFAVDASSTLTKTAHRLRVKNICVYCHDK